LKNYKSIIGLAISTLCIFLVLHQVKAQHVIEALRSADFIWLLPASLCYLGQIWLRSCRWRLLLAAVQKIPLADSFHVYAIGNMANMLMPIRAGDLIRAMLVGGVERNLSRTSAMASVVSERILDAFSLVLLLTFCIIAYPLPHWVKVSVWWLSGLAGVALIVILMLKRWEGVLLKWVALLDRYAPFRFKGIMNPLVANFTMGFSKLARDRDYLSVGIETLAIWLIQGLAVYFFLLAFNLVALYHLGFSEAMVVLAITALGVAVPSAPGFVGTFDLMGVLALGFFGVPKSLALSFAIMLHAGTLVVAVLAGFYSLKAESLTWSSIKPGLSQAADE
jgi:uncharacterized protein (TIRG00374 family)